jgi:hypothetical protein
MFYHKFTNVLQGTRFRNCGYSNKSKENIIILSIYRAPACNSDYFLNKLDSILNSIHRHNLEFIICGDKNKNYLETSSKKRNRRHVRYL